MVDIMSYLHQYVPAVEYTQSVFIPDTNESVQVQQAAFHQILFGGDQLTAARGRGAKRLRMNSISPLARLDGLIPCAEDWHTKLNLLSVSHAIIACIFIVTNKHWDVNRVFCICVYMCICTYVRVI